MKKTYTVTLEQIQAAVRIALGPVYECLDVTTQDVVDELEYMVEDVPRCLDGVIANPCPCPRGVHCQFRGMPPGDPDTEHCQQCGEYMPDPGERVKPGDTAACPACKAEYVVGAAEDMDYDDVGPAKPFVAPEDLDADDNGVLDSDSAEEAKYRAAHPELGDPEPDSGEP
jgi:hypothetical protein